MATATLPASFYPTLGLRLPYKTLTFSSVPCFPTRRSFCLASSVPRRWRLLASAEADAAPAEPEEEEGEEEMEAPPEPVEAQLAAAGAGKDADIFAVVMIGWRQ